MMSNRRMNPIEAKVRQVMIVVVGLLVLSGCKTTIDPIGILKTAVAPKSEHRVDMAGVVQASSVNAAILKSLPDDADFTRIADQYRDYPFGYYWDKAGARRALMRDERKIVAPAMNDMGGPTSIKEEKATSPDSTPLTINVFDD